MKVFQRKLNSHSGNIADAIEKGNSCHAGGGSKAIGDRQTSVATNFQ